MSAPQGLILFSGLDNILSGSFTLCHGISPSSATIVIAPQQRYVPKTGTLVLSYGPGKLSFRDCVVDRMERGYSRDGREIWTVHILDRRWRWRHGGQISGYYNVRRGYSVSKESPKLIRADPQAESIGVVAGTEKTPRQLATLCLEAMGETKYNIDALPESLFPEIEWDYENPAQALANVCEQAGCRVVLGADDSVYVVRAGEGRDIPVDSLAIDGGVDFDTPERPDELVIVTNRIRWQVDLELEAVGRDWDNSVKPIGQLFYAPKVESRYGKWAFADTKNFACVSDLKFREYAKESVFRWYRIKVPFTLDGKEKKYEVKSLDRVLPIEDRQCEWFDFGDRTEPRPAWVFGEFYSGGDWHFGRTRSKDGTQTMHDPEIRNLVQYPANQYMRPFAINRELGLVVFSEPVLQMAPFASSSSGGGERYPARLWLRTTVSLRDEKTRGWIRREISRKLKGPKLGGKPRFIRKDDIDFNILMLPSGPAWNKTNAERQANYYLDAIEREYDTKDPASISYAGFRAISPDGAIQQVTWSVGEDGFAYTKAARNREDVLITPSYAERRLFEKLGEVIRDQQQPARRRAIDQHKGRA